MATSKGNRYVTGKFAPDLRALIAHLLLLMVLKVSPRDHPFTDDLMSSVYPKLYGG